MINLYETTRGDFAPADMLTAEDAVRNYETIELGDFAKLTDEALWALVEHHRARMGTDSTRVVRRSDNGRPVLVGVWRGGRHVVETARAGRA